MTEEKEPSEAEAPGEGGLSLWRLFRRYRLRIIFTWLLVFGESSLTLLFPLFMGIAIDDYLEGSFVGLSLLAGLGLLSLAVGAGRRFYDTRIYSGIYATIAPELVDKEKARDASVSVVSARTSLATELVEFFENFFPAIINSAIGLVGTLLIILYLNFNIFVACLISTVIIALGYLATSRKTYRFNSEYNQELERRVDVLSLDDRPSIVDHFKKVMRWNIRLSDLETTNFSLSWALLIGVLVYSIVAIIDSGVTSHGKVLSTVMYVFQYTENAVILPLFYQQFVRLHEISHRLDGEPAES